MRHAIGVWLSVSKHPPENTLQCTGQRLVGHGQTAVACFLYQGLVEDDEKPFLSGCCGMPLLHVTTI